MKLRPYQDSAVRSVWQYFSDGNEGNPVVAMPTGTGKSLVISGFIKGALEVYPNQRLMMLTHVKELIEQNYDKLVKMWPTAPAGIYSSGLKRRDLHNSITFGGIGSVVKRAAEFGRIDLVIIDEAHLVSPTEGTMYQKFIGDLLLVNPNLKVIGLTATPYRLGYGCLIEKGSLFTDICYDLTTMEEFNKLIAEGYICTLIPKNTKLKLDVDGVHKRGGEFIAKELQGAVDKDSITEAAVREAIEVGSDRECWLVFASGVEHAIHIAEMLNTLGISAVAVHSGNKEHKMSGAERDNAIARFKRGEVQAIVNNNVLTTGFDHPPIDMILCLRPTSSPGLWVQMLGRGTRPVYKPGYDLETQEGRLAAIEAGGKHDCLVMDFGGNTKRLGPINDPLLPPKRGKKGGTAPVKLCEGLTKDNQICDTWIHASLKTCPHCFNEFVFETKLNQEAGTGELIKGDLPIVEEFDVDHITFEKHTKVSAPPSLKVTYYCGLRRFKEYVCLEHSGGIRHKAANWWKQHNTPSPTAIPPRAFVPATIDAALMTSSSLRASTSIRVWVNKKYPEILAHCVTGDRFGKTIHNPLAVKKVLINVK